MQSRPYSVEVPSCTSRSSLPTPAGEADQDDDARDGRTPSRSSHLVPGTGPYDSEQIVASTGPGCAGCESPTYPNVITPSATITVPTTHPRLRAHTARGSASTNVAHPIRPMRTSGNAKRVSVAELTRVRTAPTTKAAVNVQANQSRRAGRPRSWAVRRIRAANPNTVTAVTKTANSPSRPGVGVAYGVDRVQC